MPLHDHFHPPIESRLPWPSLHSGWVGELTGRLNELMPPGFVALDELRIDGGLEIDVAAVEGEDSENAAVEDSSAGGTAVATTRAVYSPPAPARSCSFQFPDISEIRVYSDRGERRLVGAIELVSPRNKDRGESREVFVAKCLDYLAAGASLVIVDVVTNRHANLHNQLVRRIGASPAVELPDDAGVYAAAYRPVIRGKRSQIDIWVRPFAIGDRLPTMPLRLIADVFVPVELELTYTEACRRRKLT